MSSDDLDEYFGWKPDQYSAAFLEKAGLIHRSALLVIKEIDFFSFRMTSHFTPPRPMLFSILFDSIRDTRHIFAFLNDPVPTIARPGDISSILRAAAPSAPWIVDYFVHCTFPAIFGDFLFQDLTDKAGLFIKQYLQDPLAPRLVGSLLQHSFVFRDRLFDDFLRRVLDFPGAVSEPKALELFADALCESVLHLSATHVQAVTDLQALDPRLAVAAIFEFCLVGTVDLWRFSQRFAIVESALGGSGASLHASLMRFCRRPPEGDAVAVLCAFVGRPTTELPESTKVLYSNGIWVALSGVDSRLLSFFHGQPETADGADPLSLYVKLKFYPTRDIAKVPEWDANAPRERRLQVMQEVRDHFFTLAGGLRVLDVAGAAAGRVLELERRRFAAALDGDADAFKAAAVAQFARPIVASWLRANLEDSALRPRVEDRLDKDIPALARDELAKARVAGADLSRALIKRCTVLVLDVRTRFPKGKGAPAEPVPEADVLAFTPLFLGALDGLYLALVARRCSRMAWGLSQAAIATPEKRAACVASYVGQATGRDLRAPASFRGFGIAEVDSLNRFLVAADAVWEGRMAVADRADIGDALLFFLEIEPWIRAVVNDDEAEVPPQELAVRLCWDPGQPADPRRLPRCGAYLTWYLLKAIVLVQALRGTRVEADAKPDFKPLGAPAPPAALDALDRMRDWFNIKPHRVTVPLTQK